MPHCIKILFISPLNKRTGEVAHFHFSHLQSVAQYFFYTAFNAQECNRYRSGTGGYVKLTTEQFLKAIATLQDMMRHHEDYLDELFAYEQLLTEELFQMKMIVERYVNGEATDEEMEDLGFRTSINMPINVATDFSRMEENRSQIKEMIFQELEFTKLSELPEKEQRARVFAEVRVLKEEVVNDCLNFRSIIMDRMHQDQPEVHAKVFGTTVPCFKIIAH